MTAALAVEDAVPLAHAVAIAVARGCEIRALVIKGPSATTHGLRPERVGADADVLISPEGFDDYVAALARCGWYERPTEDIRGPKALHSVTLIHPGWPCDIDVHREFPGFLAPPLLVFEELWRRRTTLVVAGVDLDTVDLSGAILIAALHALRTPAQTPRHAEEIGRVVNRVIPALSADAREDVLALAASTGAVDTARPALERLEIALPPAVPHGEDAALDAWRARVGGRGEVLSQWMVLIDGAPRRERVRVAARMVWPTEAEFRRLHPRTGPGKLALFAGRWARIGRGVRAAPRMVRGRVLARRGVTDSSILRGDPS